MTQEQRNIYIAMRLIHKARNMPKSDIPAFERELEILRKSLGGFQFAPILPEIKHKSDLYQEAESVSFEIFPTCTKCKRLMHYTILVGGICYTCSTKAA